MRDAERLAPGRVRTRSDVRRRVAIRARRAPGTSLRRERHRRRQIVRASRAAPLLGDPERDSHRQKRRRAEEQRALREPRAHVAVAGSRSEARTSANDSRTSASNSIGRSPSASRNSRRWIRAPSTPRGVRHRERRAPRVEAPTNSTRAPGPGPRALARLEVAAAQPPARCGVRRGGVSASTVSETPVEAAVGHRRGSPAHCARSPSARAGLGLGFAIRPGFVQGHLDGHVLSTSTRSAWASGSAAGSCSASVSRADSFQLARSSRATSTNATSMTTPMTVGSNSASQRPSATRIRKAVSPARREAGRGHYAPPR